MSETLSPPRPGAEARRFQGALQAACGAFQVHPAANPAGSVSVSRIGGFDMVKVATNARAIERDDRDARRDHVPHYFLIRQLSGHARMEQRGRQVDLAQGDFFLASSIRPALFCYGTASVQASLHLPRTPLAEALGQTAAAGLHLPAQSVLGRAVARALGRLADNPDVIADLLVIAARQQGDAALDLPHAALDLIAHRAADPTLTPAGLAQTLGVSLRMLQRALAAEGLTASGAIANRRMQAVRLLLRDRPELTVTACAQIAGFPDISRFTRDFRRQHGCSPGRFRLSLP